MMWKTVFAIAIGAAGGALRAGSSVSASMRCFRPRAAGDADREPVGAYVVGVCVAFFAQWPALSPEWRLLLITGFCGGLTTFSTFSVEVVTLLQQGRFAWAAGAIAVHVTGSLLLTLAGIGTVHFIRSVRGLV